MCHFFLGMWMFLYLLVFLHFTSLSSFLSSFLPLGIFDQPLDLSAGEVQLLAYFPDTHPLTMEFLRDAPLLVRFGEVLLAGFHALCPPLLSLALPIPPLFGLL